MDKEYTIKLTEKQARLLSLACDVLPRLICGQGQSFQDLFEQAWEKRCKKATGKPMDDEWDGGWLAMRRDAEETREKIMSRFWGLSGGSYNGIHYDDSADILWDIHQVLRHQLWIDNPSPYKSRLTVDAFPAERFGSEPLIKIESHDKE